MPLTQIVLIVVAVVFLYLAYSAVRLLEKRLSPPGEKSTRNRKAKLCENCKHWNLEAGQQIMRDNPAFNEARQHVTPRRMATQFDDNGNPRVDPKVPWECKWDEFGACSAHEEGRWKGDTCMNDENPIKRRFELKVLS